MLFGSKIKSPLQRIAIRRGETLRFEKDYLIESKAFPFQLSGSAILGGKGSPISSGLAMPRNLAGANSAQVTASYGPGIQPCSQSGNRLIDA